MLRPILTSLFLTFAVVSTGPADAASFSCMEDSRLNAAERAVCRSGTLGALDERLDSWFRRALVRAGYFEQTAEVEAAQRAWLARRDACGSNRFCLKRAYRERIRQLSDYVEHV